MKTHSEGNRNPPDPNRRTPFSSKSIVSVSHSTPVTDLSKYEKNNTSAGMCLANLFPTSLTTLFLQLSCSHTEPCGCQGQAVYLFKQKANTGC